MKQKPKNRNFHPLHRRPQANTLFSHVFRVGAPIGVKKYLKPKQVTSTFTRRMNKQAHASLTPTIAEIPEQID